jgi:hypothetical protein
MARRKQRVSARVVPVVAVTWTDAVRAMRERYSEDLPELITIGALIGETEKVYVIAQELESHDGYMTEELDTVKVPKALVIRRQDVGTAEIFAESIDEKQV